MNGCERRGQNVLIGTELSVITTRTDNVGVVDRYCS